MHRYVLVLVKGKFHLSNFLIRLYSFSKSSPNSFKFASINFETELIENYGNGRLRISENKQYSKLLFLVTLLPNVSHVIQHEKDADTVLVCQGSKFE
jgi:hypothetical protein